MTLQLSTNPPIHSSVSDRRAHLAPLTAEQKELYERVSEQYWHRWKDPSNLWLGNFNLLSQDVTLDFSHERIAVLNVLNSEGVGTVFDMRKYVHRDAKTEKVSEYFFSYRITTESNPSRLNDGVLLLTQEGDELWIDQLRNRYEGPRLGSALVQFAIEESLARGLGGGIQLTSTGMAVKFYEKLGFLKEDSRTPWGNSAKMFLPPEAITAWKVKIAACPILKEEDSQAD